MSQQLDNITRLDSSSLPAPFLGSHMTYEQIDRYGLLKGPEKYLQLIREKRNSLLSKTDWIMRPETNISQEEKELWINYRQELRDLPQSFLLLKKVVWPEIPLAERLFETQ